MAIVTPTFLGGITSSSDGTRYIPFADEGPSLDYTFPAGSVTLVAAFGEKSSGTNGAPTVSDEFSALSWSSLVSRVNGTLVVSFYLGISTSGSASTPGEIWVDFPSTQTAAVVRVARLNDVVRSTAAKVQTASNDGSGTTASCTLSENVRPTSASLIAAIWASPGTESAGTGYTALPTTESTDLGAIVAYKSPGNTTPSVTNSASSAWAAVAIEAGMVGPSVGAIAI